MICCSLSVFSTCSDSVSNRSWSAVTVVETYRSGIFCGSTETVILAEYQFGISAMFTTAAVLSNAPPSKTIHFLRRTICQYSLIWTRRSALVVCLFTFIPLALGRTLSLEKRRSLPLRQTSEILVLVGQCEAQLAA